ncbi:hypothetical protein [Paenibacillus rigui]|uniref:DUF1641 domain-containing protein n=1 Tax=Paenibacillus rigui TaxID=554312 RepID=A0A229UUI5_9BACL|nr:hypothetical protein [Paenibacillus rigui]OXM87044.1 hypothetical protein CF651_06925 [Paenibacillus rigui]
MISPTTDSQIKMVLENPEHGEALLYLLQKLPELAAGVQFMEEKAAFVHNVLSDKHSLFSMASETEAKLKSFHLTGEHVDSLVALMQKLPALLEMLEKAEQWVQFAAQVATDKESVGYLAKGLEELPLVQAGADILKETNEKFHSETDYGSISLVRLYKLLKNPVLIRGFRYVETLLEVIGKHKKS